MKQKFDAIIIGGGHNGMTAAITLAKAGQKVALVEKRNLGGLCRSIEFGPSSAKSLGTWADTGYLRRKVIADLQLQKHGLQFEEKRSSIFAPELPEKGRGLYLHHDPKEAHDEIARLSAKDAASYAQYRAFIARIRPFFQKIFDAPAPDVATMSFPGLWDIMKKAISLRALGKKDMMEVLRIGPMCVADWLGEWFESDLLRATLAGPSVYGTWCGPWSPSTNANLIISECLREPSVKGGAPELSHVLAKTAREWHVEITENKAVTKILIEDGVACGVQLDDDQVLHAKFILSSADPKTTILDLVERRYIDTRFELRIEQFRMRGTTAILHVDLSEPLTFDCRPELQPQHIRICEGIDPLEQAFDAIKYRQFSEKPALEIFTTGQVAHVAIHFVPYDIEGGWSEESRTKLYTTVVNRIATYAKKFPTLIRGHQLLTPRDIESEFNLFGGHIHHGEHAPDQLLVRPTLESANYRTPLPGLYFCGSGSHPGGGITCGPGFYGAKTVQ